MSVSRLAQKLKGSEIIKIAGEINELKKQGQKIANLTIGDFDPALFPIPDALKNSIKQAYDDHQTNYPPADGILPLRQGVSNYLADAYGLNFNTSEILISCGSRPLIYAAYLALIDPGDTVIYAAPSWNNDHYCSLTGAKGVPITTSPENNFMLTANDLRPHIKDASLIALCSPLNPTGTMFSKKDLEEICDLVLEENNRRGESEKPLYVIYDQIYAMLTFGEHTHYDPVSLRPSIKDFVVYIDGASKCFASTGVRVGWGFGPELIIEKMKTLVMHMGAWAPKAEQFAMAAFLQNSAAVETYLTTFKRKIQDSLDAIYYGFKKFKDEGLDVDVIEPMGAIYLTIKIDYVGKTTSDGQVLRNSEDVNFYLIKEAKAAFVPFSAFGADSSVNWFRSSIGACSLSDIQEMLPRIKEALLKLR